MLKQTKTNIMSVNLKLDLEIIKLSNTLGNSLDVQEFVQKMPFFEERNKYTKELSSTFIARAIWYGYIANTTAYNVQYKRNVNINFDMEGVVSFETLREGIDCLGGLIYNCYTNDGNSFLAKEWMDVLIQIEKNFVQEDEVEIPRMFID